MSFRLYILLKKEIYKYFFYRSSLKVLCCWPLNLYHLLYLFIILWGRERRWHSLFFPFFSKIYLFLSIYFVHNNILFSRLYPWLDHTTRIRTKNIFFILCILSFVGQIFSQIQTQILCIMSYSQVEWGCSQCRSIITDHQKHCANCHSMLTWKCIGSIEQVFVNLCFQ